MGRWLLSALGIGHLPSEVRNMTRNEAAERLRDGIESGPEGVNARATLQRYVDAALAEERRHVIEQIRERIQGPSDDNDGLWWRSEILSILDELSDD